MPQVGNEIAAPLVADAAREAASQVFSMVLGLEIESRETTVVDNPPPYDGVVALLTYSGDWVGAGMLCCHERFACRIGSAMLGAEVSNVDGDILDGIGEMANMILGNVKEALEPRVGRMALSIPTVVYGKNFCTRLGIKAPWTVLRFQQGDDRFEVRVCLKSQG